MAMRTWPGMREDQSAVGNDGLVEVIGASYSVDGEMRRRPGLTQIYQSGMIAMAPFRHPISGSYAAVARSTGQLGALRISTNSFTALQAGYNVDKRPYIAPFANRVYWVNDFGRTQMWDGLAAAVDAGIAGPTTDLGNVSSTGAGNCTNGVHLIRYRFLDSKSPAGAYRSNPSSVLTYTSSTGSFTFNIGAAATPIIRSTDAKVDTIQIEMTTAGGGTYYKAATALNSATSVTINISDTVLALQEQPEVLWGNYGHEQPPIAACLFECRGHAFLCGTTQRAVTVGVTNNSTSVTGTGFSLLWAGRLIRFGSETIAYEIASSTATTITLTTAYTGVTDASIDAIVYSKNPNRAYWSRQYLPESWNALEQARDVLAGFGDMVVGGCDFQGDAWFFGQRSMGRLVFADDPANGEVNPVPGYHGLWNARCLMPVDGVLYGWGPNGVWQITGGAPRWISRAIDPFLNGILDVAQADQFFAAYDPIEKVIRWHFVHEDDADDLPKYAIQFEVAQQRWSITQYRNSIACGTTLADDNGKLHLIVSTDEDGIVWYHEGPTDGVAASSSGAYTATVGSTDTIINTVETLPTGANNWLYDLVVYRPLTGEERWITDNDANFIEVYDAFATTVAPGEEIYVGSIPFSIKTDWWVNRDLSEKKRPHLHLLLHPSSTGKLRIKIYRDFQESPHTWTANADDVWPDGVTITSGRNYLEVVLGGGSASLDGFVSIPMPSDWGRCWQAEAIVLSPAGTVRLLDMRFFAGPRDNGQENEE